MGYLIHVPLVFSFLPLPVRSPRSIWELMTAHTERERGLVLNYAKPLLRVRHYTLDLYYIKAHLLHLRLLHRSRVITT